MSPRPSDRQRAQRHARTAVAWLAIGFVATQLTLAVGLERWWPDLRNPEYGHKLRLLERQIAAAPDRPLLLALGSSRTLNGLRPELLPASTAEPAPLVFNFGLTRHGPVQQCLAFDRLLRDGVRPRRATIELMPLWLPRGVRELDSEPAFRHTWGDVRFLKANDFRPASYTLDWLATRSVPSSANRFALMSRALPGWVAMAARQDYCWACTSRTGWLAPLSATGERGQTLRARMEADARAQMLAFQIGPAAQRALRLTLSRCRAEGIGTAVVMMPEASWFRGLTPPDAEQRLQELIAELTREFGVPVIDARAWCPDAEFVVDGHHLLAAGAARFTDKYAREVIPRLLNSRSH
jgi:hypothetical protein